jgi:hypothetical protein
MISKLHDAMMLFLFWKLLRRCTVQLLAFEEKNVRGTRLQISSS